MEEAFNDFLTCHNETEGRLGTLEKEFGTLISECQVLPEVHKYFIMF